MIWAVSIFLFPFFLIGRSADCDFNDFPLSITSQTNSTSTLNITSHRDRSSKSSFRYCEIDNRQSTICSGPKNTKNFSTDNFTSIELNNDRYYLLEILCEDQNDRLALSDRDGRKYKIIRVRDLIKFNSSPSPSKSNRFLEPDRTWKTSERSSIVIMVIGASAITIGVPFAIYIACKRKKRDRRRTISVVTGAMR